MSLARACVKIAGMRIVSRSCARPMQGADRPCTGACDA